MMTADDARIAKGARSNQLELFKLPSFKHFQARGLPVQAVAARLLDFGVGRLTRRERGFLLRISRLQGTFQPDDRRELERIYRKCEWRS